MRPVPTADNLTTFMCRLSGNFWKPKPPVRPEGVYTPTESSRVQSSPVRLTKTRQSLCGLLTMAASAVPTHQQSRVKSSPTSLAEPTVLMTHVPFSSVSLVIGRDGCYLEEEIDVEKLILLVKEYPFGRDGC